MYAADGWPAATRCGTVIRGTPALQDLSLDSSEIATPRLGGAPGTAFPTVIGPASLRERRRARRETEMSRGSADRSFVAPCGDPQEIGTAESLQVPVQGSAEQQAEPFTQATRDAIDHGLSWSERDLPQRVRTKHVHGLHPYLGKFIPQIPEIFLRRYFVPGDIVYDPFAGSGTTHVEALAYGCDAIGTDVSAFNCLLTDVKTGHFRASQELQLKGILRAAVEGSNDRLGNSTAWLDAWYAPTALNELLAYKAAMNELMEPDTQRIAAVVLSRAARSARQTAHFDLDFPRNPINGPYHCFKHKRTCRPVQEALKFLRRYTTDTIRRLMEFDAVRTDRQAIVLHADARTIELPQSPSGIITSPPYPGLIDYHQQHRYSFELLELEDRRADEIGAAATGVSRAALRRYTDDMVTVFENAIAQMPQCAPVVIVINDSRGLYPEILERSGLELTDRLTRHVNRRTGRRAGEFFEHVLICRAKR